MKKLKAAVSAILAVVVFSSCGVVDMEKAAEIIDKLDKKPPQNWYEDILDYYVYGASTGWVDENLYGDNNSKLKAEMKDPANRLGYCLVDLNGDGGMEFMVGFIDNSEETRFTDMWYYHPDFKKGMSWTAECDGYYLYICEGNVLRNDTSIPRDSSEYMTMNKDPVDGFLKQQYDDPPKPLKFELTPFDEVELPYTVVANDELTKS